MGRELHRALLLASVAEERLDLDAGSEGAGDVAGAVCGFAVEYQDLITELQAANAGFDPILLVLGDDAGREWFHG